MFPQFGGLEALHWIDKRAFPSNIFRRRIESSSKELLETSTGAGRVREELFMLAETSAWDWFHRRVESSNLASGTVEPRSKVCLL